MNVHTKNSETDLIRRCYTSPNDISAIINYVESRDDASATDGEIDLKIKVN